MQKFTGKKLAVFGDSIIDGAGNNKYGVGEYLAKDMGFTLLKYSCGGARVGYCKGKHWLIDQLKQFLSDGNTPDYIIFNGFTNDCYRTDEVHFDSALGEIPSSPKAIEELGEGDDFSVCFLAFVDALKKNFPQAKILFMRPHKMGRREAVAQREYGDRAAEICAMYSIPVADIYNDSDMDTFKEDDRDKYTADSYNWGRGDCTHPNKAGYEEKYMPLIEAAILKL